MLTHNKILTTMAIVLSITGLTACGGGAGESGGTTPPTIVNKAPTASNVNITDSNGGNAVVGDVLSASYQYNDAENDSEGSSVLQWLSNNIVISGATTLTYTLTSNDTDANISFKVTPKASSGTTTGAAVSSASVQVTVPVVQGPDKDEFMNGLSSWSNFAPKQKDEADEGREIVNANVDPIIEEVTDGEGLTKVCTTETVDFFRSPEEYVMFAPPTNILYPGAFVEGRSIRDGNKAGDILPLNIQQRNDIEVSIPACTFANNFRVVSPSLSNVNSAVGAIIAEASALGLDCVEPRGNLKVETFRNEQQRALSAGFSGKYFGFSGSASGSYSKGTTQNSVAAVFRESLYTVQIEAPQTPGDWFTDEFTPDKIEQLETAGRLSDTNIPAYVAQVTYGRILTSTFTSSYSETDMRAAIEFKYSNPAASVQGDAAVSSQTIRENSSTTLAYLGGSAEATSAMLRSNDWTEYFNLPVTAADAVPISFELRSTSDNTLAVSQELTSYQRTTCLDRVVDNATFAFQAKETFTPSFTGTGQQTAFGDINGDGADDIVWVNSNASAYGEIAVAFSQNDGRFSTLENTVNMNASSKSGELRLLIADIDNDGREDIVLNIVNATSSGNSVYVSFYKKNEQDISGFVHSSEQDIAQGSSGWHTYKTLVGQMDKSRGADLVWNNVPTSTTTNRTYIAHAVDTTVDGFDLSTDSLFVKAPYTDVKRNFSSYSSTFIADLDGDGHDDIIWQALTSSANAVAYRYGTATGLGPWSQKSQGSSWNSYTTLVGDINGDGRADMVYPRMRNAFPSFGIYSRLAVLSQSQSFLGNTFLYYRGDEDKVIEPLMGVSSPLRPNMAMADVNGDGTDDLIINEKGKLDPLANNIAVGLAIAGTSEFSFSRAAQKLPQSEDWSQYTLFVADINGDNREDVIWVRNASSNDIFVGIARGN